METILIVDDNVTDREILASLLSRAGYDVMHADDGVEALEIARARNPQLIISEVPLPSMGGIELADHLHDDPAIAHTPIILHTRTCDAGEARVLARSCRAAAILMKPVQPEEVLDTVAAALGTTGGIASTEYVTAHRDSTRAKLPNDFHELGGLQARLAHMLENAVEHAELRRAAATESDAVAYSSHCLSVRLATLLELDLAMSSLRDPAAMLGLFLRVAQEMLHCRYAGVGIAAADGSHFEHFASRGLDPAVVTLLSALDPVGGLSANPVSTEPTRLASLEGDGPTTLGLPAFHPPVSALLIVPLPARAMASPRGWIYFAETLNGRGFDDEDEQFAVTLAMQLAIAYGNLSLYEQSRLHGLELETEIGERRRSQCELAHRASHDQTTGLPRIAMIEGRLQAAIDATRPRERVTLLYVDMDRFHAINDTRGRAIGDDVLRIVAGRLTAACEGIGYVAHIASDEFAIVLIDKGNERDRRAVAEALRSEIERTIEQGGQRIYVSCSIGLTCFPDNGSTPQEMLSQAEAAMRCAKHDGRNTVRAFGNEHKQALEDRGTLGLALGDAIRDGQLVVHYQPQLRTHDLRILGFEALVRWQNPELGLLSPARFIGVAEELGLIVDVGNFMLASACRQARTWLDAGMPEFSISVNVSSVELQRPDFVEGVEHALRTWAVPGHHIELELTEGAMIGNVERMIGTMHALKNLGVLLALDDFGTGFSSLNYLRRFPIDKLKIDQSFVLDIGSDPSASAICRAIIALGHQLGMIVLAEGVETAAQAGFLRDNDCDQFQGFHFGKPASAAHASALLQCGPPRDPHDERCSSSAGKRCHPPVEHAVTAAFAADR